jgi:hypothetical protein
MSDQHDPDAVAMSSGLRAMFTKQINVADKLGEWLGGRTLSGEGGTITFASGTKVRADWTRRELYVSPPATAKIASMRGSANVTGIKLSQDFRTATPMIAGLPDWFSLELVWE